MSTIEQRIKETKKVIEDSSVELLRLCTIQALYNDIEEFVLPDGSRGWWTPRVHAIANRIDINVLLLGTPGHGATTTLSSPQDAARLVRYGALYYDGVVAGSDPQVRVTVYSRLPVDVARGWKAFNESNGAVSMIDALRATTDDLLISENAWRRPC